MTPSSPSGFIAQDVALEAVCLLRPLIQQIARQDRHLAVQLKRAASSVVLNLAEAAYNNAGHRRARFESARGSANEARAALSVARGWGYISDADFEPLDERYHRILAMTYRLWTRA